MSADVSPRVRRRDRILPDQHGAWGFVVLPVVLGAAAGGWAWALVPIAAAWVSAYPLTWALSGRLTAPRRRERFDRALLTWATVAGPLALISLAMRPWLVWVGLAYLVPLAINLAFARARRERDVLNDLLLVAECAIAVPVIAGVAAAPSGWMPPWSAIATTDVALAMLLCALPLAGSTLHVKSLIRERANPTYTTAARTFSAACVPVVFAASLAADRTGWLAIPFLALYLRAQFLHNPRWRPARIGLIELAGLVVVAAFALTFLPD